MLNIKNEKSSKAHSQKAIIKVAQAKPIKNSISLPKKTKSLVETKFCTVGKITLRKREERSLTTASSIYLNTEIKPGNEVVPYTKQIINQSNRAHFQSHKNQVGRNQAGVYSGFENVNKVSNEISHERIPCIKPNKVQSQIYMPYKESSHFKHYSIIKSVSLSTIESVKKHKDVKKLDVQRSKLNSSAANVHKKVNVCSSVTKYLNLDKKCSDTKRTLCNKNLYKNLQSYISTSKDLSTDRALTKVPHKQIFINFAETKLRDKFESAVINLNIQREVIINPHEELSTINSLRSIRTNTAELEENMTIDYTKNSLNIYLLKIKKYILRYLNYYDIVRLGNRAVFKSYIQIMSCINFSIFNMRLSQMNDLVSSYY